MILDDAKYLARKTLPAEANVIAIMDVTEAIVTAFNAGIQSAADGVGNFKLHWQGRKVALYGVVEATLSLKIEKSK